MAENIVSDESTSPDENPLASVNRGKLIYEAQLQKLMDALDARRNMPFDPMMMRVAAGFLKPSKTGSFGESLGYAAEGASEEAEKEAARKTDVEKLKLELASKGYELEQQAAGQKLFYDALPGAKKTKISTTTSGAPSDGMTTEQVVDMVKSDPSALDKITLDPVRVAAISATYPALGKVAENLYKNQVEQAKVEMGRYEMNAQGDIFDKATHKIIQYGSRMVDVASPFDPDVKMPIRASDLDSYQKLDFSDPSAVNTWLRSHGLNAYAIGKGGKSTDVSGVAEPAGGTKMERETAKEIKTERAKSDIKANTEQINTITARQDASGDIINNATSIYRYANDPNTAKAFGVLSKPGVLPAVLSAVQEGIRVGPYNVGFGGVEDAVRKAGGTQAEIDAAASAARNLSQLELGFSSAFKGQGQVSDNERRIVAAIGPKMSDSPKVMALKSESIIARAKFDEENGRRYLAWEKKHPNEYVRDYMQSPEYIDLKTHYNNKLGSILTKYGIK